MHSWMALGVVVQAAAVTEQQEQPSYSRGYVRQPVPHEGVSYATIDQATLDVAAAPPAIDWSELGATTPVKDQGKCGGCWAFATTEGVESAVFRSTGSLPENLSTEQLIDCEHRDLGCKGGDIPEAVRYLMKQGQDTDAHYPDESSKHGRNKRCTWEGCGPDLRDSRHWVKETRPLIPATKGCAANVTGFSYAIPQCKRGDCEHQSEDKLAAAVAQYGPISICVNSGDRQPGDWMKYKGGVLTKPCEAKAKKIDHCVQLVGYNKTATTPYWKIRNSWGTKWGEGGFIRLEMFNKNMCCVGCEAVIINAR
eukprot:COSAG02_NODE_745_length_17738_cov_18.178241_13_plen_309_part_00